MRRSKTSAGREVINRTAEFEKANPRVVRSFEDFKSSFADFRKVEGQFKNNAGSAQESQVGARLRA